MGMGMGMVKMTQALLYLGLAGGESKFPTDALEAQPNFSLTLFTGSDHALEKYSQTPFSSSRSHACSPHLTYVPIPM